MAQLILSDSYTALSQRVASHEVRKTCVIGLPDVSFSLAVPRERNNRSIRLLGKHHGWTNEVEWKTIGIGRKRRVVQ